MTSGQPSQQGQKNETGGRTSSRDDASWERQRRNGWRIGWFPFDLPIVAREIGVWSAFVTPEASIKEESCGISCWNCSHFGRQRHARDLATI
jgi:hypothetical protein